MTTDLSALPPTNNSNVVFACVGTDRSTGDSLGPLVGSLLIQRGYKNVIGSLDDPLHGGNLHELHLPKNKTIIAIDACLGSAASVGRVKSVKGPLRPGAGVGREDLPSIGEYHIQGIVNIGGFMEYFVLQNTRLSLVMKMAESIADSLAEMYPLNTPAQEVAAAHE